MEPTLSIATNLYRSEYSVNVNSISTGLLIFAKDFALAMLYAKLGACTITSGRDGIHVTGSFHATGRALDFRTRDLPPDKQLMQLLLACQIAAGTKITIFDESNLPGNPHLHVEDHG
jgi:hypothetical protein